MAAGPVPIIARNEAAVFTFGAAQMSFQGLHDFECYGHGISGLWKHPEFPHQLLHCDFGTSSTTVLQRTVNAEAHQAAAVDMVERAVGWRPPLRKLVVVPLRLRVPMVGRVPGVAPDLMRARPVPGLPIVRLDRAMPIEVKVVATRSGAGVPPTLSVDACLGGGYETRNGQSRSLLYLADHRRLEQLNESMIESLLRDAADALCAVIELLRARYGLQPTAPRSRSASFTAVELKNGSLDLPGLAEFVDRLRRNGIPGDPYLQECEAALRREVAAARGGRHLVDAQPNHLLRQARALFARSAALPSPG